MSKEHSNRKHGPGKGMQPGEKPKDFNGSIKKMIRYIGGYKIAILIVMIVAVLSTILNVISPKIMGKATTALSSDLDSLPKLQVPAVLILNGLVRFYF